MSFTSFRRGDVVLVRFPNADLRTYRLRPGLVVQADGLPTGLPQSIIALITSNLSRTGPTRVSVLQHTPAGRQMGLRTDSVVVTDNLQTVVEREIDRAIGSCPVMRQVDTALRITLAL